ncbi:4Fe-4S binding protein, partial [candidate division WOR-3 bacterium]|nr:4Fe-4S binding protein [candidate division WOR-3 bacterium]
VYNQSNVITIISDNRTTGMTGHQEHPGTGKTLTGKFSPVIKPEEIAKACGVKNVVVVDPYKVKETRKTVREILAKDEPAVIINRRACALHIRLHNPPYKIDPDKCNGCKTCITLGCPALSFVGGKTGTVPSQGPVRLPGTVPDFSASETAPSRGKALITEDLCVGCGMCADVCPKEAIAQRTKDEAEMTKSQPGRTA